MQEGERNRLIEENYHHVEKISAALCGIYSIQDISEVHSLCLVAVTEATPKWTGQGTLEGFWFVCCRNRLLNELKREGARQAKLAEWRDIAREHRRP